MSILKSLAVAKSSTSALASRFAHKEDGAVAMVLGLAMIPFCMMVGLSVDYGRSVHMKQKFASALDSATLAAARHVKDGILSDDEVKARAFDFFKENVKGSYAVFNDDDFNITIDRANSRVDIKLPVYVPTTFARIGGFERMRIDQQAQAVFVVRDIEVGLALDVTGSMDTRIDGRRKIDSLKTAFSKFADLMLPANPVSGQKVRLGLAPYDAGINLGAYANVATGGASPNGCVAERDAPAYVYSDAAPGGLANFRHAPGMSCPSETVLPMTSNKAMLVDAVNAYTPGTTTAGHIGAQWAWNLISPEWGAVWGGTAAGEAYTNKKVVKAVILMTDGQFNRRYFNGKSSAEQAIMTCEAMKAKGVQVFTLGFGLDNTGAGKDAKNTLSKCATPGPDYYVDAANEAELDAAFAKFAGKINALRLSQ